jgi:hypothetical protein
MNNIDRARKGSITRTRGEEKDVFWMRVEDPCPAVLSSEQSTVHAPRRVGESKKGKHDTREKLSKWHAEWK